MNFKEVYEKYQALKEKINGIDAVITIMHNDHHSELVEESFVYVRSLLKREKSRLQEILEEHDTLHVYDLVDDE